VRFVATKAIRVVRGFGGDLLDHRTRSASWFAGGTSTWASAAAEGGSAFGGYLQPPAGISGESGSSGDGAAAFWPGGSGSANVLGQPSSNSGRALDGNTSSVAVGRVGTVDISWPRLWPYFGAEKSLFDPGSPHGELGVASGINEQGLVTGSVGKASDGSDARAFIYDLPGGGDVTILDPLPGHLRAGGTAINDAGHVVGFPAKRGARACGCLSTGMGKLRISARERLAP
jgi:hypothetical protein